MARIMKRTTALVLALILILGQIALPVIADDNSAPVPSNGTTTVVVPEITVDLTSPTTGAVIGSQTSGTVQVETPVPNGTQTDVIDYSNGSTAEADGGTVKTHKYGEIDTESTTHTVTPQPDKTEENDYLIDTPLDEQEYGHEKETERTDPHDVGGSTNPTDVEGSEEAGKGQWDAVDPDADPNVVDSNPLPGSDTDATPENVTLNLNEIFESLKKRNEELKVTMQVPGESGVTTAIDRVELTIEEISNKAITDEQLDGFKKDPNYKVTEIVDEATGLVIGYTIEHTELTDALDGTNGSEDKDGIVSNNDGVKWVKNEALTKRDPEPIQQWEDAITAQGEAGEQTIGENTTQSVSKNVADDGKITYTVVTTEKTYSDNTNNPTVSAPPSTDRITTYGNWEFTFTPPTKPAEVDDTDPDTGNHTKSTVTPLYAGDDTFDYSLYKTADNKSVVGDNVPVAYRVDTEIKDANGKVIRTETSIKYGVADQKREILYLDPKTMETTIWYENTTVTTNSISATKVTETWEAVETGTDVNVDEYTTFTDTYQLVKGEDGYQYLELEGKLYAIMGNSKIVEEGTYIDNMDNSQDWSEVGGDSTKWKLEGNENWPYRVIQRYTDENGNAQEQLRYPKRFIIGNGNQRRYVYCIEVGQGANVDNTPIYGGQYFEQEGTMDGNGAKGNLPGVRSVSTNGYWGTEEGLGSLEAVRSLMKRQGGRYAELASSLDAEDAMAATQMAMWAATTPGSTFELQYPDAHEETKLLYDLLMEIAAKDVQEVVNAKNNLDNMTLEERKALVGAATPLEASHITGTSIKINSKVEGAAVETFDTDVSFTVSITESAFTGNMVVNVLGEDGDTMGHYILAKSNSNIANVIQNMNLDGVVKSIGRELGYVYVNDDGQTYTLKGLKLPNGKEFSLNLVGVQEIDKGVRIHENKDSQDFVSLMKKTQEVDIKMKMEFTVTDPAAQHSDTEIIKEKTTSFAVERTNSKKMEYVVTVNMESDVSTEKTKTRKQIFGTKTEDEEVISRTREFERWDEYGEYPLWDGSAIDGEGGGGIPMLLNLDIPDEPVPMVHEPGIGIPDEGVPLADAPATGDASLIWAAMSVMSMGGYVFLGKKEKKSNKGGKFLTK